MFGNDSNSDFERYLTDAYGDSENFVIVDILNQSHVS